MCAAIHDVTTVSARAFLLRSPSGEHRLDQMHSGWCQPIPLASLFTRTALSCLNRELRSLAHKIPKRHSDVSDAKSELLELGIDLLRIDVRLTPSDVEPVSNHKRFLIFS